MGRRRSRPDRLAAFLVVDKPPGLTSHDVVAIVRAVTGLSKVGHTGTLDPFASGVLVLALGEATRLIRFLDEQRKVYDARVAFGAATTTGDPEGEVSRTGPPVDPARVPQAVEAMQGESLQRRPAYSAVKVGGQPLYRYARRGEAVEAEPRPITIYEARAEEVDPEGRWARVIWVCSRGTYARVLADDLARSLGTAGHLSELRRTASGRFGLDRAITLPELARIVGGSEDWRRVLATRAQERVPWRPRAEVLAGLAPWLVDPDAALAHLPVAERPRGATAAPIPPAGVKDGGFYRVAERGRLVGVARRQGVVGRMEVTLRLPAAR